MADTELSDSIIEIEDLTRQFILYRRNGRHWRRTRETLTAVDRMTFRIERGSAVGYIGANGAGKSTTIKMLTGILVPTAGTVRTCGLDPVRQRRELAARIGVVFGQRSQLWWDLPLRESFSILAAIHRLESDVARKRTYELVEQLEMAETLDTPVRQLSLGQRMRAEVAAALPERELAHGSVQCLGHLQLFDQLIGTFARDIGFQPVDRGENRKRFAQR